MERVVPVQEWVQEQLQEQVGLCTTQLNWISVTGTMGCVLPKAQGCARQGEACGPVFMGGPASLHQGARIFCKPLTCKLHVNSNGHGLPGSSYLLCFPRA